MNMAIGGFHEKHQRQKFGVILKSEDHDVDDLPGYRRNSDVDLSAVGSSSSDAAKAYYSNPSSALSSPPYNMMSPWIQPSPYAKSPWIHQPGNEARDGLVGSLLRSDGHVYSIAAAGDLLYTGSESRNIRVWKNFEEFSGFKSRSGLVKAIVVFENKIFTGHQDGKIRIWKSVGKKNNTPKRLGNLPSSRDLLKKALNPQNYVAARRKRSVPWIKHYDAVSCISIDENQGLLYSGSWDKTWKVWRISDSECLESMQGHEDAVNAITVAFYGLVFTGSADGTVKAWRRELVGKSTQHVLVETLLKQDHAVTSLTVNPRAGALYAGSSDGLVSFWERRKHFMSYSGVLRGHKQAVLSLASAGNLVISGSADKSICVWRRESSGEHTCVAVLAGHNGPIKCLATVKDDEASTAEEEKWILYSGSLDRSVKKWRISEFGQG